MEELYQPYFGGVNTKIADELKKSGDLREAVNVSLDSVGKIKKRTGYVQKGDTLESGKSVLGMAAYYPSTGTNYLVAATNDSTDTDAVLKYRTTQNYNFTLATIDAAANTKFEFATFIDYLFGVGANSSGTFITPFTVSNDMTYSTTTNVTSAPKAKYICALHGYLLLANGYDGDDHASSRVWWPDPPASLPYETVWNNSENYWDFQPFDGDEITGIIATSANRALVFKNYSIHAFEPVAETSVRISGNIGCVSPRSIKNVGGLTLFLGRGGVYATTGGEPILISGPVEDYINGINWDNALDFCAGVEKDRYYRLFIGDLTSPDTFDKTELLYDTTQNQWVVNTLSHTVKVYCNYVEASATTSTSTSSSSSSSSTSTTP